MEKLAHYYPGCGPAWTKNGSLPGGNIDGDRDSYAAKLRRQHGWMTESLARRYARTYGSHSEIILANANSLSDLGEDFGHDLYEAELRYLVEKEWVVELDDALWRRTKLGMWLSEEQQARVKTWLAENAKPKALSLAS